MKQTFFKILFYALLEAACDVSNHKIIYIYVELDLEKCKMSY